jgi:uncharacterized protein with FMN-binding domain
MLSKNKILSAIIVIAVALGAFTFALFNRKPANQPTADISTPTPTTPTPVDTTPVPAVTDTKTLRYKNGTYTATGSYNSPGGPDQIGVSITISNDIVTAASVTPMPGDRTSARYQGMFASGYQSYVVGKDIDSIKLNVVSGSSLTPIGFNDALAKIKAEAKS